MKAPEDVGILVELLDRQVQHLLAHPDASILPRLPAFLGFLVEEPRLAGLIDDMRTEADEYLGEHVAVCHDVMAELRTIWASCRPLLEPVRAADGSDACHWAELGFEEFAALLETEPEIKSSEGDTSLDTVAGRRSRCSHWVKCGSQSKAVRVEDKAVFDATLGRLSVLKEKLDEAATNVRLHVYGHGGFAYELLEQTVEGLVPHPSDGPEGWRVTLRNEEAKNTWRQIGVFETFRSMAGVKLDMVPVVQWIERVQLDLQARLARGRSRRAIVRRYAARCETFDRLRLLQVIKATKASQKVEEALTLDFARYLFDMGFNPLVDPKIAGLRPDLLDPSQGTGFYVEAKQYTTASASAFSKYVSQVFDTWGRLRNTYDLPEAFLLVFRLGGRKVDLPEVVKSCGRSLNLHLVDLAPAAKTGSRAKQAPLVLTEADLLPKGGIR
jgi:hypothetical protein